MPDIPGSYDLIRKALEYLLARITEHRKRGEPVDHARLLDEAGMRFNLSPMDASALERLLTEHTNVNRTT